MGRMGVRFLARAATIAAGLAAGAAGPPPCVGLWLTQDRQGVIDIEPCGGELCGKIVGTSNPRDCGRLILTVAPARDGVWSGRITNPEDGKVWQVELWQEQGAPGQLKLRGYIALPLLGVTQTWTRYAGGLAEDCRMN